MRPSRPDPIVLFIFTDRLDREPKGVGFGESRVLAQLSEHFDGDVRGDPVIYWPMTRQEVARASEKE